MDMHDPIDVAIRVTEKLAAEKRAEDMQLWEQWK